MSKAALQDAQWLKSLPQNLFSDFDRFFWNQPDAAKAWYSEETSTNVADTAFLANTTLLHKVG